MLQSGYIPFYIAPSNEQIAHVDAWIRSLPCCAVVTKQGVNYVGEPESVDRLHCFMDGFNYTMFKRLNTKKKTYYTLASGTDVDEINLGDLQGI